MLRGAQIMLWALVIADCVAFMPASPSARDPVLQVCLAPYLTGFRVMENPSAGFMAPAVQAGVGMLRHEASLRHAASASC